MPIFNLTQKTILASTVETADTSLKRMKGLLGRTSLSGQEALVITGCNSIHMLFMKFAIDVVFINKKDVVVGVVAKIKPFRCSPIFWKATCAIELPAGTIEATQTRMGDQIKIS